MNLRIAAALVVLIIGTLLLIVSTRRSEPVSQVNPDATELSESVGPSIKFPTSSVPEGNPEVPEEVAEASADSVLPGPVLPLPKPVALASMEDASTELSGSETESGIPPVTSLENMRGVFRHYYQRFGGNPVGDNAEISAVLGRQNPKQVNFVNPDDGMRLNDRGELVDNWGTPYFFHQLSRTEMEIHSAGPDRKLWTADDLVMK